MRIPLTKYGWPQVFIFPAAIIIVMLLWLATGILFLPGWVTGLIEILLGLLLIWVLLFFRDPYRLSPLDKKLILAPADGKITDIETLEQNNFIEGKAIKIGIFLSIFDAHINRSPCNVKVENITYKKGQYLDARDPQASQVNESNDLTLIRIDQPQDKLLVRQISGAIAKRIVCQAQQGQRLSCGEKFGMIKFGSRTELYLPARDDVEMLAKIGDKVKAGISPLARYKKCKD